MSKKQSKKEAAARTWNQSYVFKRALKLEPTGAIAATIYKAVRQVKRGTASEITDAANKLGLNKQTKQDPRGMVLSLLRQFAEKGAIEIVRDGEKAAAAPAKAKAKTGKKKVRLIVKEAAASGDSASA